jgi:hypothetical protein
VGSAVSNASASNTDEAAARQVEAPAPRGGRAPERGGDGDRAVGRRSGLLQGAPEDLRRMVRARRTRYGALVLPHPGTVERPVEFEADCYGGGSFVVDGYGRVVGADATSFFAMSGLSRADLKQVSAMRPRSISAAWPCVVAIDEWILMCSFLWICERRFGRSQILSVRGTSDSPTQL